MGICTVLQLAVLNDVDKHYWNNYKSDNEYWIDHLGTGYFIHKKKMNTVVFEKNFPQKSRYQNSGKENSGDWVNLVLDHGKAPKGLSYEYVVLPQTYFGKKDKNTIRNSYEVIQHDQDAHIVKDRLSKTTSFVFFETPQSLPKSIISYVDTTCLIMLKEEKANVVDLTVANPDLALYREGADEIYDALGKRVERSIYSRPWISNESQEVPVTVTLNGEWAIVKNDGFIQADVKEEQTILIFKCKDGTSINVELKRVL